MVSAVLVCVHVCWCVCVCVLGVTLWWCHVVMVILICVFKSLILYYLFMLCGCVTCWLWPGHCPCPGTGPVPGAKPEPWPGSWCPCQDTVSPQVQDLLHVLLHDVRVKAEFLSHDDSHDSSGEKGAIVQFPAQSFYLTMCSVFLCLHLSNQ